METIEIDAKRREQLGTKDAKRLRQEGKVPCVLYGGDDVHHLEAPALSFRDFLQTSYIYIAQLNVNGDEYRAIIKDVQFDPVTDNLIHVDLQELVDKPLEIEIPIEFVGKPIGEDEGGVRLTKRRSVRVKGLPRELPDHLEVDISELEVGDSVNVGDIEVKDIEILTRDELTLLRIGEPTELTDIPTAEEAAAAPEGFEDLEEGEIPEEELEAMEAEEGEEVAEGEEGEAAEGEEEGEDEEEDKE